MSRRTKIIATIGPASDAPSTLEGMIQAGMDVARIGLAHGSLEEQLARYRRVRSAAAAVGRPVGILIDLPGPKVRAGSFGDEGLLLIEGMPIRLTPGGGRSTPEVIEVEYDDLLDDVRPGDRLMVGDGVVTIEVEDQEGDHLVGTIAHGGWVQGRPGVHIPSDRLRMRSPTEQDMRLLDAFLAEGVEIVALSFVRSAEDVHGIGTAPHPEGPLVVAKIETRAAVENLESIVDASGAIMVARGDLGEEYPIEELPHLQKDIIGKCIAMGRPVITATQMLESMIHAPSPTRAEATDVANAVFDGSSAVMLSAETAIGADPVRVIATMSRIAARADERFDREKWAEGLSMRQMIEAAGLDARVTDTMTTAAWRAAAGMGAAAIICITRSGFTARAIARFRPAAQILAYTSNPRTLQQLTMSWGATPLPSEAHGSFSEMADWVVADAKRHGMVESGDVVVLLAGSSETSAATDTVRMVRVP